MEQKLQVLYVPDSRISDDFYLRVVDACSALPESIQHLLGNLGYKVLLPRLLTDCYPDFKNKPLGPDNAWSILKTGSRTYDHVKGIHDRNKRQIVFPEYRIRNLIGAYIPKISKNPTNICLSTLFHEIGHAIDDIPRFYTPEKTSFSTFSGFGKAYCEDIRQLGVISKLRYKLKLDGSNTSRRELFADAIAVILMQSSHRLDSGFRTDEFPTVCAFVKGVLSGLEDFRAICKCSNCLGFSENQGITA